MLNVVLTERGYSHEREVLKMSGDICAQSCCL